MYPVYPAGGFRPSSSLPLSRVSMGSSSTEAGVPDGSGREWPARSVLKTYASCVAALLRMASAAKAASPSARSSKYAWKRPSAVYMSASPACMAWEHG